MREKEGSKKEKKSRSKGEAWLPCRIVFVPFEPFDSC
jgi:hypothetical protein